MYAIFLLGMVILFFIAIRATSKEIKSVNTRIDNKANLDCEFGAAFIRVALKHYDLREGDPNQVNIDVVKLQKEEDKLIRNYLKRLEQQQTSSVSSISSYSIKS
ncbi:hypothetical protein D5018_03805 [Parashewanella curva]|uniref:Uncharacterized protein n=1 Tax=Parashewanella curva TaxID=2338552 RepID=A0A3L8PZT9_9GAMM|nr:hypothetical protein [Parashewanella curva]RLV60976.1 hypothetical protein D5018_03805 [Parashewanella curva]